MPKITLTLNYNDIENALKQLDIKSKLKIMRNLEMETRKERWQPIISYIRKNFKKNPISYKEITDICENVRQKLYEERFKQ